MKTQNNSKRILVTGISCFVGFHLCMSLNKKGYSVFGILSNKFNIYKGVRKERLKILKNLGIKFIKANMLNYSKVYFLIKNIKPQIIYHLAADTTGITNNKFSLHRSTSNNLIFIENLYNSINDNKTKVIIGTTNAEYKNIEGKVNENSSCQPSFNTYGLSKLSATLKALQFAEIKNIKTAVIRIFNPIGPYDAEHKLLSQVIKALKENKPIDLSPCTHKRDFIYIDKLVNGMVKIIKLLNITKKKSIIINLCYGKPTEIKKILLIIANGLNADKEILNFGKLNLRVGEPINNYGDNSRAKKELNWNQGNIFKDVKKWIKEI